MFKTDPSGSCSEWKAATTGRNNKTVREYLEKNYENNMTEDSSIKLCLRALLEVVESGAKNVEIVVLRSLKPQETLSKKKIQEWVKIIKAEDDDDGDNNNNN